MDEDPNTTGGAHAAARRVLISAHRGGCGRRREVENTLAAFEHAIATGSDYVEFDIQRTADGHYLLTHDDRIKVNGTNRYISDLSAATVDALLGRRVRFEEALALLATHDRKAHLDFKFASQPDTTQTESAGETWEVEATTIALAHLSPTDFIVTTTEDHSVRILRDWADTHDISLMVGLSIGRHRLTGMAWWQQVRWRAEELFPARRVRTCRANLIVAHRLLARARLLKWAHANNLPVLVWTVDNPSELRRLLSDPRVWMVTSNFPERGLGLQPST
jgi:glycerophosphoryl diester phosphodiesterase